MRRSMILVATVISVAAMLGTYVVASGRRPAGEPYPSPTATREDLLAVSDARVFFAHQSVGGNILEGFPAVYAAQGLPAPGVNDLADGAPGNQLVHTRVGKNGDPLGKIEEFDTLLRGGLAEDTDVAVLKLCYSDVRAETDVDEVFTAYRDTMAALQEDYPKTTVVAATVPLTIRRSAVGTMKQWVGRGDKYGPEHNLAREQFNALLRAEHAETGLLFDVASIESTSSDGPRTTGMHEGQLYYALGREHAKDPGHLNEAGGTVVADGMLAVLATALRD